MKNEAENSLRETRGDGNGQGQNSDEYERFHWTCYRHVEMEMQGNGGIYGETLTQVPSRASTRRPALTRRSTIRAAASEET